MDIEVELEDYQIDALIEAGLAKRVLELTPAGNAWIAEYCAEKLGRVQGVHDHGPLDPCGRGCPAR